MDIIIERKIVVTEYVTIYDTKKHILDECLEDIYNGVMELESLSTTDKYDYECDYGEDRGEVLEVVLVSNADTGKTYELKK